MTPAVYCRDKVAAPGTTLYYSLRRLDPDRREAISALHAVGRELRDAANQPSEAAVAQVKLGWWREEIAQTFAGNPRHPAAQALAQAVSRYHLPEEYFHEMLDGYEACPSGPGFASFNDQSLYCYRVAGTLSLMCSEVLGYRDRRTTRFALRLGTALELTRILRELARDIGNHRVYLPTDEMEQAGISTQVLLQREPGPELLTLLDAQAERAHRYYGEALDSLPDEDRKAQTPALILSGINRAILREIQRDRNAILGQEIDLTPIRKLWIAWTTQRQASG